MVEDMLVCQVVGGVVYTGRSGACEMETKEGEEADYKQSIRTKTGPMSSAEGKCSDS